jgi:hypothetical protein
MHKKFTLVAAALAATVLLAQPALASTVITFTGNSSTDGTDGNIRTYSNGGISVQASGWSFEGNTREKAYLGAYSSGLGVTNNDEIGNLSNSHTADNVGQSDFILLVFNQAVNIASAGLTPFDVSSDINDNDALVSYATLAGAFTSPTPTAIALNSSVWSSLLANDYNVPGNNNSPYNTSLNSAGKFGNVWLIGASRPNLDSRDDGFKLSSITVNSAVPEPATWAMMLIGFGAIGAGMRRRKANTPRLNFNFA